MKHLQQENELLKYVHQIPSKMLRLHGQEQLPHFVLHDLCHERCFNIDRAAYFVDNPDFDCLKGVAGYSKDDACAVKGVDIWHEQQVFTNHLDKSLFNQRVRHGLHRSSKRANQSDEDIAHQIAESLDMEPFGYCIWPLKHDNHGVLIYEASEIAGMPFPDHLKNTVCLLGFCPIH